MKRLHRGPGKMYLAADSQITGEFVNYEIACPDSYRGHPGTNFVHLSIAKIVLVRDDIS